ncbi:hypothetical protein ACTORR_26400 [Pseudomonas sp. SAR267]|uniref:hypothetical protein n=1 Tax=unclassified Pseudomonas TaxID=196821 RepID=UPI0028AA9984|nr:hypothetical protein [Pseudomonas sp.]
MSTQRVAKVKMYNTTLKAGFLDHEIEDDDVILEREAVGSLNLKNGDEVTFDVEKRGDKYYAKDVKLK